MILIGIQARSGSTRLPGKAFELIAGRTTLDRVVEACKAASMHITRKSSVPSRVAILTPTGDRIAQDFKNRCDVVEGDEWDVLSRYAKAMEEFCPTHIVRVTGDCPLIPPSAIDGLVNIGLRNAYDYVTNADERYRTTLDGMDCEMLSAKALRWLQETATEASDREHVTPLIRRDPPSWAKRGLLMGTLDLSHIKLSVDTQEDLETARVAFDRSFGKYQAAMKAYGSGRVHRL